MGSSLIGPSAVILRYYVRQSIWHTPDRAFRLQARLLAGLSIEETAVAEGLNAETVRLFAALFFDVLDCLDAFDYIHFIAIDFQPFACQPPGRNTLIKLMAYHGGPYVLNQLLAAMATDHSEATCKALPGATGYFPHRELLQTLVMPAASRRPSRRSCRGY